MRVNNGSSDPVTWEQEGSGGPPQGSLTQQSQSGSLGAGKDIGPIEPVGDSPWEVIFTNQVKPQTARSGKFDDSEATVTLNDDWTVTVS